MLLEISGEITPEKWRDRAKAKTTPSCGCDWWSKVQCCKEQYSIGTWSVRSMNQGKLEVVKQEMARVNVDILGISELKWTGIGEFNSDDHYIYYCGQESLRRNGVAIMVNKKNQFISNPQCYWHLSLLCMQWERNPLLILNNWLKFYIVFQCFTVKKITPWDLPGGPVVKAPPSNAVCEGLIPGWVTKIWHAVWCSQKHFFNYFLTLLLLVTRDLIYNHTE